MTEGNIYIVTAPSGAGKTTLVTALLAADPSMRLSVSYTTREPRSNEEDGKSYYFVSENTFFEMIKRQKFLEYAEIYGCYYGTSSAWIEDTLLSKHDVLLEIDWQGAQQVLKKVPQAISIFILPPSLKELEQRLRERGADCEEKITERLNLAKKEIMHFINFDYVIVNEFIDEAVRDITSIIRAERLTVKKRKKECLALFEDIN